jgi:uncharacterized protein YoxC
VEPHFLFELTVSVIALLVLAINLVIWWRMYGVLRALSKTAETTRGQLEPILQEAHDLVKETRQGVSAVLTHAQASISAVTAAAEEITEITREQVIEARALGRDSVLVARNQVERVDELVARTIARVDDTVAIVQKQVLEPIREIHCWIVAARRALEVLLGRKRKQLDEAYQDEEMFI